MKKELILMRHGKSDWSKRLSDFQRPIKKRGFKESARIGRWLGEQNLVPDLIISSPAMRARETAETVAENMDYDSENIFWNDPVYMADVNDLLDTIAITSEECQRLMLVGHNPGMEDLLFYLNEDVEVPEDGKIMPTSTIALLETESTWNELEDDSCTTKIIVRGRYL